MAFDHIAKKTCFGIHFGRLCGSSCSSSALLEPLGAALRPPGAVLEEPSDALGGHEAAIGASWAPMGHFGYFLLELWISFGASFELFSYLW